MSLTHEDTMSVVVRPSILLLVIVLTSVGHALPVSSLNSVQQPATTDPGLVHLLLQTQNYLLQLQSIAADHKEALRNIQGWVNDLKVTDQFLRYNLTQQGREMESQLQKHEEDIVNVHLETVNLTTLFRDVDATVAGLHNKTHLLRIITNAKLDNLSQDMASLETNLDSQIQQSHRELRIIYSSLHQHQSFITKLEQKSAALSAKVSYFLTNLTNDMQVLSDSVDNMTHNIGEQFRMSIVQESQIKRMGQVLQSHESMITDQNETFTTEFLNLRLSSNSLTSDVRALENLAVNANRSLEKQQNATNSQESQIRLLELIMTKQGEQIAALNASIGQAKDIHKLDFTQHKSSAYRYVSQTVSWTEAESCCQLLHPDAHLAIVETSDENDFIWELINKERVTKDHRYTWIGGSDRDNEGQWKWLDGKSITYSKWKRGEPNNGNGKEDCLDMWTSGEWNDSRCNAKRPFVCEMNAD